MGGSTVHAPPQHSIGAGMAPTRPPAHTPGAQGTTREGAVPHSVARGCLRLRRPAVGEAAGLCPPHAPAPPGTVPRPEGPTSDPRDGVFPAYHLAANHRCRIVIGRSAHSGAPRPCRPGGARHRVTGGAHL